MGKKSNIFKLAGMTAMISLVAACGGGGGSSTNQNTDTPTAEVEKGPKFRLFTANASGATQNNAGTLWATDGTANGTIELTSTQTIVAGVSVYVDDDKKVIFPAVTPAEGSEMWVSDGTVAGTTRLTDINPGSGSSIAGTPLTVGDSVYFLARQASNATPELYVTDGTAQGTQVAIPNTPISSRGRAFQPSGSEYFSDGKRLYSIFEEVGQPGNKYLTAFDPSKSGLARFTVFSNLTNISTIGELVSIANDDNNTYAVIGQINGGRDKNLVKIEESSLSDVAGQSSSIKFIFGNSNFVTRFQNKLDKIMALNVATTSASTRVQSYDSSGQSANTTITLPTGISHSDFFNNIEENGTFVADGHIYVPIKASGNAFDLIAHMLRISSDGSVQEVTIGNNAAGSLHSQFLSANFYPLEINGKIYFIASNKESNSTDPGCRGIEVWAMEGTTADMIEDLNTTGCNVAPSKSAGAVAFIGQIGETKMVFAGQKTSNGTTTGFEPFILDGKTEKTEIIKDLATGTASSFFVQL